MVCSSSIAEKKSCMALAPSEGFGGAFEGSGWLLVGVGCFGTEAGAQPTVPREGVTHSLGSSSFLVTPRDFPPFLAFWSAAALFALYSIRFCSKCGSLKYSSREPTREMGACLYGSDDCFRKGRDDLTCLRFGIGTLRRFWSFLATPRNSTTRSVCLQKCR